MRLDDTEQAKQECDPQSRVFQHELHLSEWETCQAAQAAIKGLSTEAMDSSLLTASTFEACDDRAVTRAHAHERGGLAEKPVEIGVPCWGRHQ